MKEKEKGADRSSNSYFHPQSIEHGIEKGSIISATFDYHWIETKLSFFRLECLLPMPFLSTLTILRACDNGELRTATAQHWMHDSPPLQSIPFNRILCSFIPRIPCHPRSHFIRKILFCAGFVYVKWKRAKNTQATHAKKKFPVVSNKKFIVV